jgi:hypothetical protein
MGQSGGFPPLAIQVCFFWLEHFEVPDVPHDVRVVGTILEKPEGRKRSTRRLIYAAEHFI